MFKYSLITLIFLIGCSDEPNAPYVTDVPSDNPNIPQVNPVNEQSKCSPEGSEKTCRITIKTGGYTSCWDVACVCKDGVFVQKK